MPENDVQPSTWRLSIFDYRTSLDLELRGAPFYAIIAVAMRQADSDNIRRLRLMWPEIYEDLQAWRNTPGALG